MRSNLSDPTLVNELLRLDGPVQATARTATMDHRVGGTDIAAGQQLLVVIAAANRDPGVFDRPANSGSERTDAAPLSDTARTTASARLWHNSKLTRRCKGSLPANPSWRAR